jgi:hypothetical protein
MLVLMLVTLVDQEVEQQLQHLMVELEVQEHLTQLQEQQQLLLVVEEVLQENVNL